MSFGNTAAAGFLVDSDTEITATSPPGDGTVDVTVTTPAGASATGPADRFQYTTISGRAPAVVPGSPVATGPSTASLSGQVNPDGLVTTAHFEYGLDARYRGQGASGVIYDQSTAPETVGSDLSAHAVTATLTGLVPNAEYHVRLVAINAVGTVDGPDQTFTTLAGPAPPPPVLGREVNLVPVSGIVFVKLPPGRAPTAAGRSLGRATPTKGQGFIPLTEARQLPTGTQIDARQGSLKLISAAGQRGTTQTGTFGGAIFAITQSTRPIQEGLTTLTLLEGAFPGAPTYASCPAAARSAAPAVANLTKLSPRILQTLHAGDHNGSFRTRGRYSAATVRGTVWTMTDACDGN